MDDKTALEQTRRENKQLRDLIRNQDVQISNLKDAVDKLTSRLTVLGNRVARVQSESRNTKGTTFSLKNDVERLKRMILK